MIRFSQLSGIINGKTIFLSDDIDIEHLCVDSRKAGNAKKTLFFAIAGDRHDGHDYLPSLYRSGIRNYVIERDVALDQIVGSNIVKVDSATSALQNLAAFHRHQFNLPVIGITGSNGKTIIKEWLFQMLSADKVVVKNPGSYNSQIGVPLSVWQIQAHHQLAIFEAGISRVGEMSKLETIIRPTIGIFSNIGSAHDEGFADQQQKINEKLKLFANSEVLIYCRDHSELHDTISKTSLRTFTWGQHNSDVIAKHENRKLIVMYRNLNLQLETNFTDKASKENLMHCLAVMLYLGYDETNLQSKVQLLRSIPMRMALKEGINHSLVIDDTYNNDLGGLEIALQFLANQHQKKVKRLILSDILESGLDDRHLVDSIVTVVQRHGIQKVVCIGPVLGRHHSMFPESTLFFRDTKHFLREFDFEELQDEVVLVKGARKFTFEKITARLQRKVHGTVMEIDLNAVINNLNFFKSKLLPQTKIMVMVKAFAYGSGSIEIANLLQYHQADYLGVAYADEGIDLRKNNITLPIMVMNPSEASFDSLINYSLEPEVYNIRILRSLIAYLKGRSCRVHLKLDTGMHRLGFDIGSLDELMELLQRNPGIRVNSIFSHLAGADEGTHDDFSKQQYEKFINAADSLSKSIGYKPMYHLLNTPGILRLPQYQLDMVRLGIGLYGVDPTADSFSDLKPVATLKTFISQITFVHKGETIGYGRSGVAQEDTTIATIAIGYADGYSRAFSRGVGAVLINGKRVKVIGNVCMDMTMVDITGIRAVEGDEVIIFGKDFPIQAVASSIQSIPYEILTSTSERVKRVFIADGI